MGLPRPDAGTPVHDYLALIIVTNSDLEMALLREIHNTWTGVTWFIEGDISDCYGSFDHEILLGILAEKIHDLGCWSFCRVNALGVIEPH